MPAVTAKTNVISQAAHPARAVALWRAPQRAAAQEGMTRAKRSETIPMARKSKPAAAVEPSDLANHPFMVMPTTASAKAATVERGGWPCLQYVCRHRDRERWCCALPAAFLVPYKRGRARRRSSVFWVGVDVGGKHTQRRASNTPFGRFDSKHGFFRSRPRSKARGL
jgi:hypothetical protein